MKKAPHLIYLERLKARNDEILRKHPDLRHAVKEASDKGFSIAETIGILKSADEGNGKDEKIEFVSNYENMANLEEAQEVCITYEKGKEFSRWGTEMTQTNMYKVLFYEEFKIPFKRMVITYLDSEGEYLDVFVVINEDRQKYKDGETLRTIYNMALMRLPDDASVLRAMIFSASFTPTILPRMFIQTDVGNICKSCPHAVNGNFIFLKSDSAMLKNLGNKLKASGPDENIIMCMKNPRTADICKKLTDGTTYAKLVTLTFFQVYTAIERFYEDPEIIDRVARIKRQQDSEKDASKRNSDTNDTNVIYVGRPRYVYHDSNAEGGDKRTHSSPCEHLRRGHYRRYKSGKMTWVSEITVNKGKKRSIYKI